MESVQMNKFEIVDMPGMNTLAFLVEENESEVISGQTYYSLQKLDHTDKEMDGKITKEFFHYKSKSVLENKNRCSNCPHGLDKEHEKLRNSHFDFSKYLNFKLDKEELSNAENVEIFNGDE